MPVRSLQRRPWPQREHRTIEKKPVTIGQPVQKRTAHRRRLTFQALINRIENPEQFTITMRTIDGDIAAIRRGLKRDDVISYGLSKGVIKGRNHLRSLYRLIVYARARARQHKAARLFKYKI